MDPASIVGLVEFGLSCASAISRVISDIQGGAEDARKLITQIEVTVLVVKELDRVIDENKRTKGFIQHGLSLVQNSREECERILTKLRSLLVKSGATVTTKTPPGQFYKIDAKHIDRSIFRKADWARHKRTFDDVAKELEAVKNSVLVALQVYSVSVARRATDRKRRMRELRQLLEYLRDSGKSPEDLVPSLSSAASSSTSLQGPAITSLVGPGPGAQNIGMQNNPNITTGRNPGNGAPGDDNSTSSQYAASSSPSARLRPQNEVVERLETFQDLESNPLWRQALRKRLEQNSRRPTDGSEPKGRNQDHIPQMLRDQDRPNGVALTRSFLLSKADSGAWTSREWECPFDELLKRLNRKGTVQDALRAFGRLPQSCKDLITQISEDDTENFYWTALLIDPISGEKESWLTRLFKREARRADDVSSVLAVLKRCKQVVDIDRELTTALDEVGTLMSSGIRMKMQKELLDEMREQNKANDLSRKQADEEKLKLEQERHRLELEVQRIGMELESARTQAKAKAEAEAMEARERALAQEALAKALADEKAAKERAVALSKQMTETLQQTKEEAQRKQEDDKRAREEAQREATKKALEEARKKAEDEARSREEAIRNARDEAEAKAVADARASKEAYEKAMVEKEEELMRSRAELQMLKNRGERGEEEGRIGHEENGLKEEYERQRAEFERNYAEQQRDLEHFKKEAIRAEKERIEKEEMAKKAAAEEWERRKESAKKKDEEKRAVAQLAREAEEKRKAAEEEKRRKDEERVCKLEEIIMEFRDKKKESDDKKPQADEKKPPIKFKDAVGRKFSFPWHLCNNWKGMEALVKQAFLHVDVLGQQVHNGHYDLVGPDGEIILPQIWEATVEPGWEVSMHMWPMEEPAPPPKPMPPFPGGPMPPPPPAAGQFPMEPDWIQLGMPPSGSGPKKARGRRTGGPSKTDKSLGREKSTKKPPKVSAPPPIVEVLDPGVGRPRPAAPPKKPAPAANFGLLRWMAGSKSKPGKNTAPLPGLVIEERRREKTEPLPPVEELARKALIAYSGTGDVFRSEENTSSRSSSRSSTSESGGARIGSEDGSSSYMSEA
ncbi:hypothetical protein IWZ01DRAFT_508952 [Phyllosticta capitalensis]